MGSVAAGLASIGGSVAEARELQRREALERVKLALEQSRLGAEQSQAEIQKQYAGIAGIREKREQAEFEEKKRLANLPKFVGYRAVGGRLFAGLMQPDGTLKTQEITGVDSAQDAQVLEESIMALPAEAQDAARATVGPYVATQDYQGARGALKPILQKYAESMLPGTDITTSTQQGFVVDTPQGQKIEQVPKITVTHKGPAGSAGGVARGGTAPGAPKTYNQIAKSLGLPSNTTTVGTKPASRAEISKLIDPLGDADRRYKVMLDASAHPNPQNDVAMLFNHIGMTLSAQRGARITSAEIERAISAREISGDLLAMWQKVTSGQFLTPQQRQDMLALGKKNREFIWQQAWEKAKVETLADKLPKTLPGLPPVAGIHFVGEDVQLSQGGRARVAKINADGSYEVKPY
jgi:hypothetical protein